MNNNHTNDEDRNSDEKLPDIFRSVVSIIKTASGETIVFACKHTIPAMPYWKYRLGDLHICHRCSAKIMANFK